MERLINRNGKIMCLNLHIAKGVDDTKRREIKRLFVSEDLERMEDFEKCLHKLKLEVSIKKTDDKVNITVKKENL